MANQVQTPEARALLEKAGITPTELRILTGAAPTTMSGWWRRGIPPYVLSILDAFAVLSTEDRERIIANRSVA